MNEENSFTIETAGEDRAAVIETKETEPVVEAKTEEKPKSNKPRAQKRIEGLSHDKRELSKENQELKDRIAELEKVDTPDKPDIVDYDEPEEYDAAMDTYSEQLIESKKEPEKTEKIDYDFRSTLDEIESKFDIARDKYDDFDDVVKSSDASFTQTMVESMNEIENSGEVAYALAGDVEEIKRISKLSQKKQIIEILKFGQDLGTKKPKQKKQTKAADPIVPTLGAGGSREKSVHDADNFQDYSAMRTEQTVSKGGW